MELRFVCLPRGGGKTTAMIDYIVGMAPSFSAKSPCYVVSESHQSARHIYRSLVESGIDMTYVKVTTAYTAESLRGWHRYGTLFIDNLDLIEKGPAYDYQVVVDNCSMMSPELTIVFSTGRPPFPVTRSKMDQLRHESWQQGYDQAVEDMATHLTKLKRPHYSSDRE